jgi:hypothetical protein
MCGGEQKTYMYVYAEIALQIWQISLSQSPIYCITFRDIF